MRTQLRFARFSVWLLFVAVMLLGQVSAQVETLRGYQFTRLPALPENRTPCLWTIGPKREVVYGGLAANGTTALFRWNSSVSQWVRFGDGVGTFCQATGLDLEGNTQTPKTGQVGFLQDGSLFASGLTGDGKQSDLWLIGPNGASNQIATGELTAPSLLVSGAPLTIIRRTSEVQEWRSGSWVTITQGSIFTSHFYRTADALFWSDVVNAFHYDLASKTLIRLTNPLPAGRNQPFEPDYNVVPDSNGTG